MEKINFKKNPLLTSLEALGQETIEDCYNPTIVYFNSLNGAKTKAIKGNSVYYYFKPDRTFLSESKLDGILVYQNKELDITLVYKVNEDKIADFETIYFDKFNIDTWRLNHFEYISHDKIIFRLNEANWIDLKIFSKNLICV